MRITLLLLGAFGLLFFAGLFTATYGIPEKLENSAKRFVQSQINKEISEKYAAAADTNITNKALKIANSLGYEEEKIREGINNNLPEKIAEVIASMCGYDCEKKKALAQSITAGYLEKISNLQFAQKQLGEIIKGKYLEIVENLRADLRIFLGSNSVMFATLLLIALLKPKVAAHLFLPGMLLLVATIISSSIYIFGQDWFYTIIYNDYMGYGYVAYISTIFGLLMDIVFNKAKVTTEIINAFFNAIGSALSVAPC